MCASAAAEMLNSYETGPDHQLRLHLKHLNLGLLDSLMVSKNSTTEPIIQQNNHDFVLLYCTRIASMV